MSVRCSILSYYLLILFMVRNIYFVLCVITIDTFLYYLEILTTPHTGIRRPNDIPRAVE